MTKGAKKCLSYRKCEKRATTCKTHWCVRVCMIGNVRKSNYILNALVCRFQRKTEEKNEKHFRVRYRIVCTRKNGNNPSYVKIPAHVLCSICVFYVLCTNRNSICVRVHKWNVSPVVVCDVCVCVCDVLFSSNSAQK